MKVRENSFDLIRHFAAFLVLYSHHFALLRLPEPVLLNWNSLGFTAVVIFFAISGYLMPGSFSSSGNFAVFMEKRCRRIFPGLIVCSLIMCYGIGSFFTEQPIHYLFSFSTLKSTLLYSTLSGESIPGVFANFLYPHVINGSLWTLPIEFASYIIIGIALSYANSIKSVLFLFVSFIFIAIVLLRIGRSVTFYNVPLNFLALFGIAFTTGALMAMLKQYWFSACLCLMLTTAVFFYLLQMKPGIPELQVIGVFCLALLTIIIGESFKDKLIKGRFDLSYGIYIYAFPTQQLVINLITQQVGLSLLLSALLTSCMAYLSYRFIEKRYLFSNLPNDKCFTLIEKSR